MVLVNPQYHLKNLYPIVVMEYRTLEGFEDIEANEFGEVRWVRSKTKLKVYSNEMPGGSTSCYFKYYTDRMYTNQKCISAFNLIARLFVPNPNNYKFVQAIDGNNSNFSASNLEWVRTRRRRPTPAVEDN